MHGGSGIEFHGTVLGTVVSSVLGGVPVGGCRNRATRCAPAPGSRNGGPGW